MKIEIDQSGKIEDTNRLTVVAFANGKIKSLKISAVEKQKLVKTMRILDYPKRTFVFKIFAGLIFLLIKDEKTEELFIDQEYPGQEATIKNLLLHFFRKEGRNMPFINFINIGRGSRAHIAAWEVYRGKRNADMIIGADDVMNILYKKTNRRSHSR